jgi:hypothetical protein
MPFTEWKSEHRLTLTFSRDGDTRAQAEWMFDAITEYIQELGYGATLTVTRGVWQGREEFGVRVEFVGARLSGAVADLPETGPKQVAQWAARYQCKSIQVEEYCPTGYTCREWQYFDTITD